MAYQVATIKKTTVVTSAKRAVGGADGYCNEIKKHKGKEVEGGILIGQTYFTSRPRGTLSAHGFGKKEVARLNRTRGLADNEATLEFIQEHCRKQKLKGRKIMGLRLILSMDPVKVTQLLMDQVDIDRLLVRVAEDTFSTIARKFYPGDELGFVLGIHHDARVHGNDAWVSYMAANATSAASTETGAAASLADNGDGNYVYTFAKNIADAANAGTTYDANATHRFAMQVSQSGTSVSRRWKRASSAVRAMRSNVPGNSKAAMAGAPGATGRLIRPVSSATTTAPFPCSRESSRSRHRLPRPPPSDRD